jgi:NitT/TauT family transport system permease protein
MTSRFINPHNWTIAAVLLTAWIVASALNLFNPVLIPTPGSVAALFFSVTYWAELSLDLQSTVSRLVIGYVLGSSLGIVVGFAMGMSTRISGLLALPVDFSRSIPVAALFPIFLVLFGIGNLSKIATIAWSTALTVLVPVMYGVATRPRTREYYARTLRATTPQIISTVVVPDALPSILAGLRTGLAIAMIVAVMTEMFLGSSSGVGYRLITAATLFRSNDLYLAVFVTGMVGYALNQGFLGAERRLLAWNTATPSAPLAALLRLPVAGSTRMSGYARQSAVRFVLYAIVCTALGYAWHSSGEEEFGVIVVSMITLALAFVAIDLAIEHKNALTYAVADVQTSSDALGVQSRELEAHTAELRMVRELIQDVYGLDDYIREAIGIYRDRSQRVVTSLHFWVGNRAIGTQIESGIRNTNSHEMVFIGCIAWNHFLPGVFWRFNVLYEVLHTPGQTVPLERGQIWHVDDTIPVFVVSKPRPSDGRSGRLLVGNPAARGSTRIYGIKYHDRDPILVDFYNFITDAYVCPAPRIRDHLSNLVIESAVGIYQYLNVRLPTIRDGLQQLLQLEELQTKVYAGHVVQSSDEDGAMGELRWKIARDFVREWSPLREQALQTEDGQFLMNETEAHEACDRLLRNLHDVGILRFTKRGTTASFELAVPVNDLTCECLLKRPA